jgi:hypothetical protein
MLLYNLERGSWYCRRTCALKKVRSRQFGGCHFRFGQWLQSVACSPSLWNDAFLNVEPKRVLLVRKSFDFVDFISVLQSMHGKGSMFR